MSLIRNFWLLWAALAAIVLGYATLSGGMLSIGPLLLVAGYCVLLPFFLWRAFRKNLGDKNVGE